MNHDILHPLNISEKQIQKLFQHKGDINAVAHMDE